MHEAEPHGPLFSFPKPSQRPEESGVVKVLGSRILSKRSSCLLRATPVCGRTGDRTMYAESQALNLFTFLYNIFISTNDKLTGKTLEV